jgi:hypothetical protein
LKMGILRIRVPNDSLTHFAKSGIIMYVLKRNNIKRGEKQWKRIRKSL